MKKKLLILSAMCFSVFVSSAQSIAKFKLTLDRPTNGLSIPASIHLDEISFGHDSTISLFQVSGKSRKQVPIQINEQADRTLSWNVHSSDNNEINYELVQSAPATFEHIKAIKNDSSITISNHDKNLLRYYHATVNPPKGQDLNYRRSGFIHPVWTPHGQELTRIQAPDHYHHYGIWNPWTHVEFEKDTVDFWNIKDPKTPKPHII